MGTIARYPEDTEAASAGSVMYGDFEILDQWFAAMDSGAVTHGFTFNFGVSLMVECADQAELDTYWSQLSSIPDAEQCGWCADKFGVSWQLVPAKLADLMSKPGSYDKLVSMKKIEVAALAEPSAWAPTETCRFAGRNLQGFRVAASAAGGGDLLNRSSANCLVERRRIVWERPWRSSRRGVATRPVDAACRGKN